MNNKNNQIMKKCLFPPVYAINETQGQNEIRQLSIPARLVDVLVEQYETPAFQGRILTPIEKNSTPILLIANTKKLAEIKFSDDASKKFERVLQVFSKDIHIDNEKLDLSGGIWIRHPDILGESKNYKTCLEEIIKSWRGAFSLAEELSPDHLQGLRTPQIGALYAVYAHWTTSNEAATIVMPTGTGKTEVMLAVFVSRLCSRLLVVVPNDALRTQIGERFLSLGILKTLGIVSESAKYPIVGFLRNIPRNVDEVDEWFAKCNVIVTTMEVVGPCKVVVQKRIAHHCPFLFVDEAHHLGAPTWSEFKQQFINNHILQFTATPFRNDDRLVDGKIIYNYPLKKAMDEEYFKPIHFSPVEEYDPRKMDKAIVEQAVKQLRKDLNAGYNHILMARVKDKSRAREIIALYRQYPEFDPVQLHTGIAKKERQRIKSQVLSGKSKIVVCVDMLGEGFDLPELKIAAFHDIKKSLPITLQLTGRFTRARTDLGQPTIIANIGDVDVQDELHKLYAQDSDWNVLLPQRSHTVIQKQIDLLEFLKGFKNLPKDIPLQNLRPNLYTVLYKTTCDSWKPENFEKGLEDKATIEKIYSDINLHKDTMLILIARHIPVDWADVRGMYNLDWELLVLFWDRDQHILFINSSGCKSHCRKLADAVMGKGNITQIRGPDIFRGFSEISRLRLQNVGLKPFPSGNITYTMWAGPNVVPGLSTSQKSKGVPTNLSGSGYQDGQRISLGGSIGGRVWSHKPKDLSNITKNCTEIGKRILNETIVTNEVLEGMLIPKIISERPNKMPIGIEWPEIFYSQPEVAHRFIIKIGQRKITLPLFNTDIQLKNPAKTGDIQFEVFCDSEEINREFILSIYQDGYNITGGTNMYVIHDGYERLLKTFFEENPPTIWFHDGSFLEGNRYITIPKKGEYEAYPRKKIIDWDWDGVDFTKESQIDIKKALQIIEKEKDSIQYSVIQKLVGKKDYDLIFDDDDSGESADVVGVKNLKSELYVEFYHCKFSEKTTSGARIGDLYAVCGQAQKSVQWAAKPEELFDHLHKREPRTSKKSGQIISRFEVGDSNTLQMLKNMSLNMPVKFKIFIVQPGLSKLKSSDEQLMLLAVTEDYLLDTYNVHFEVISSH